MSNSYYNSYPTNQDTRYCPLREGYVKRYPTCFDCPHKRFGCRAADIRNGNP